MATVIKASANYPIICCIELLGVVYLNPHSFLSIFGYPNAWQLPTPVSAICISATMVKAGIFLMLGFTQPLADTNLWFFNCMSLTGLATSLLATYVHVQTDLERPF